VRHRFPCFGGQRAILIAFEPVVSVSIRSSYSPSGNAASKARTFRPLVGGARKLHSVVLEQSPAATGFVLDIGKCDGVTRLVANPAVEIFLETRAAISGRPRRHSR
jgi:hypothetical protein